MRLEIEPNVAPPALSNDLGAADLLAANSGIEQKLKSAIAAAQSGDPNTARVLLFKVTEQDPSNVDAWLWLASISEYPEELLGFLVKVLEIDPQNQRARQWDRATRSLLAKTFVQRGLEASENGQDEMASQSFDQALEYDLSCESAWLGKSSLSRSVEEKELCLARVLDLNPNNRDAQRALNEINFNRSEAKMNAGRVAAFAGEVEAAEATLDSILAADPENVAALKLRSQLNVSFSAKLDIYRRVLMLDPNDVFTRAEYDYLTNEQALAEAATYEPTGVASDPSEEAQTPQIADVDTSNIVSEALASLTNEAPEPIDLFQLSVDLSAYMPEAEPTPFEAESALDEPKFETSADAPQDEEAKMLEHLEGLQTGPLADLSSCDFCGGNNDLQAYSCASCNALLSLSDIDALFSKSNADTETIQDAVKRMEAELDLRDFSESELTTLGLGHFNLQNFEQGLTYFQEASFLNPNNVILAGLVNACAIRFEELRRQIENHDALPKGKTILVVDDSATVRKLISSKLEKSGHNVICAVDGVDAMEIIENVVPDLVLLDIAMPRMDGYSVCKLIRANDILRDVPVVMISGKDGFFDKVRGRMAGTTGYITKPFGPETLMRALDIYLISESVGEFVDAEMLEA
jgi:CheY-like chemotaxis protein